MLPPFNSPPKTILVICTRRIGDVLLTTPLIHSLRRAWPQADIDALVFNGTEEILRGNPDLREVLTVPQRPTFQEHLHLAMQLRHRYDLAITTQPGDRPTLYAWLAGRTRIGFTDPARPDGLKTRMLHAALPFDNLDTHTVRMNLRLTELLGIEPIAEVVLPETNEPLSTTGLRGDGNELPYAVLHPFPRYTYKQWHEDGWAAVSHWLADRGVRTILTGGNSPEELEYIAALNRKMPPQTLNLAGRTSLPQVAAIIEGAVAFVGPDTATTHLAAATGVPTVALFGPSNPVKWGPWPRDWPAHQEPYQLHGTQRRGNVTLLRGAGECVPCMQEGCWRHVRSTSNCLTGLPASAVIRTLESLLGQDAEQAPATPRSFPLHHVS